MSFFERALLLLSLLLSGGGCEPADIPGGRLEEIHLQLVGKNPGIEGRYLLLVGEKAALRANGRYDNGREEDITLSLFWQARPEEYAQVGCQRDDLSASRVVVEATSPGLLEVSAASREIDGFCIPCSPTPDGGWRFPAPGADWPLQSEPLPLEVR